MLESVPLTRTFGAVVASATPSSRLTALDAGEVAALYRSSGAVLFRGFPVDVDDFADFSARFTAGFVVNGEATREYVSEEERIQTVNAGHQLIPLHAEMGYSPFRPDLIWFYCAVPPRAEGQTMLCDGVEAWERLDPELRETFRTKRVRYVFSRTRAVAQGFERAWAEERLRAAEGVRSYRFHDDGSLDMEYVVTAAPPARHRDAPAFANSVIVEDRRVSFEDGSPITRPVRLELFELTARLAYMHTWRAGDVLMIDNSRVMHGRAPFGKDDDRRILVRMGAEAFAPRG